MRRVSYHQNLFDALGIPPWPTSTAAVQMIEEHEARLAKRLPESVREWYSFGGVVELVPNEDWGYSRPSGLRWFRYSNDDRPCAVRSVLEEFAAGRTDVFGGHEGYVCVMIENQGCARWYLRPDGSEDPPVLVDNDVPAEDAWTVEGPFSDFVLRWFVSYASEEWHGTLPEAHRNNLWLRCPRAAAVLPPYLDQLLEAFPEHKVSGGEDGPKTYDLTGEGARLCITTDHWETKKGHSAWWLTADSEEALEGHARQICRICDLVNQLKSDTEEGHAVLERLRSSE